MIEKPLNEITIADLELLVINSVSEGRKIDFKRDLCGTSDGDKKEFLADVSSFANAIGGDLLFGVDEADGVAVGIPGLNGLDAESTILRLESAIRDGIEPRIPGIQFQVVECGIGGSVLIVRIPNSWASPHMVTFKGTSRFFTRGSAGKFQMDVAEIKAAFDATGLLSKRIAEWRTDRLGKVIAGDGPYRMANAGCLVVHLVSLNSFDQRLFNASELNAHGLNFPPLNASGWNHRLNVDGVVHYRQAKELSEVAETYTQVFRSGAVEAVSSRLLRESDGNQFVASVAYEERIIRGVTEYLSSLKQLGVSPPILIMISLLGVKGAFMHVDPAYGVDYHPFDRDNIVIPEILIEDLDCNVARSLRPGFDMVWNACGLSRSFNYNNDGDWAPRR